MIWQSESGSLLEFEQSTFSGTALVLLSLCTSASGYG